MSNPGKRFSAVCANEYTRGSLSKLDLYRTDYIEYTTEDVIMTKLHAILGSGSSMDSLVRFTPCSVLPTVLIPGYMYIYLYTYLYMVFLCLS